MNIPEIDPRILEESRKMSEEKTQKARRKWLEDNVFNIINSVIAVIALLVAILGLFLPAR